MLTITCVDAGLQMIARSWCKGIWGTRRRFLGGAVYSSVNNEGGGRGVTPLAPSAGLVGGPGACGAQDAGLPASVHLSIVR